MTILIPTGTFDVDPTEVSVPWKILQEHGHDICFATDTGKSAVADPIMLSGAGLGILKSLLIAQQPAQETYQTLLQDKAFQNPIHYDDIRVEDFEAILLPGGHAKGIIPYLESPVLQNAIAGFFATNKPIAAICHGVVAACRAKNPETGKSVLWGRKTTALLKRQETLAYHVTKRKMGDYFLTYPITVQDEVTATLKSADDFIEGPLPILRDNMAHLSRGFTHRDGNYLSARWPGDVHRFALEFVGMLQE